MERMTKNDWALIAESLKYTRSAFSDYQFYPSDEYKQKRLGEVDDVIGKVWERLRTPRTVRQKTV